MQFFKMTIRPYTVPEVLNLGLMSMKMHFNIFPGQRNHQTNIIKPLWLYLEYSEKQIPPPSSLKQLEDVLHEERYNIPLETIQNLYQSIPRMIQAVLQANGGPTLY